MRSVGHEEHDLDSKADLSCRDPFAALMTYEQTGSVPINLLDITTRTAEKLHHACTYTTTGGQFAWVNGIPDSKSCATSLKNDFIIIVAAER